MLDAAARTGMELGALRASVRALAQLHQLWWSSYFGQLEKFEGC
ncbi:hypothetical protein [Polaromonas sp. CG9_12]|nr:hypothetical protein [Polaromonas sp. CG9_12]